MMMACIWLRSSINPSPQPNTRRTYMDHETGKGADSSAWPQGIAAITLFVEDLAAAKQFYQKAFGLPVVFEDDNSTVFRFGNTLVNLLKSTEADEVIAPARMASREAGSRAV